jgi:protein transport protein SEC24
MRIRCTRGLRITNFLGNYFIRANDLLALPNCTPDSVFGVEIGFDEQVLTANVISMQAALLYTTTGGERRIRVHNVAVPVQTVLTEVRLYAVCFL